jgi:salicylate hydroxylase
LQFQDAAVLATLLPKISRKSEIPAILRLFEKARKTRAEEIVDGAYQNGKRMHLASGKDQEERDAAFRAVKHGGPNPDKSADPDVQAWLFGFDCIAEAEKLSAAEYGR